MVIKKPIPITFNLDSHQSVQSVCAVIHIDDKNTETLDLSLMQGGEHIAVSQNSTVTARFVRVKDKILISDNVACTVQENGNIHIPIDNAAAHMLVGEIKIEVNIVDENDILTMQFPLVIRVNNTILADAEISPESEGTIPELLEETREAAESATQAAEAATEAISTKQDKLTAGQNITITEENVISASSGSNDYTDLTNKPSINNVTLSGNKSSDDLSLQDKLTAGENITIDENNVISAEGGVTDYDELENKPQINGVELTGNKTTSDLNLQDKLTAGNNITIENNVISAEGGGATSYNDLTDKPQINGVTLSGNKASGSDLGLQSKLYVSPDDPIKLGGYSVEGYQYIYFDSSDFFREISLQNIYTIESGYAVVWYQNDAKSFFERGEIPVPELGLYIKYKGGYNNQSYYAIYLSFGTGKYYYRDYVNGILSNWEAIGGGAQIVSGVVNVNGTITFTDSEGNSFTTSGESVIGADGFSPVATVTQTVSGATVSITDKNGTTTANISNGTPGQDYVLSAQDKTDIANIVLGELPTTEGVLYGNQSN